MPTTLALLLFALTPGALLQVTAVPATKLTAASIPDQTVGKDWESVADGDGTTCKTYTVTNTGDEPAQVKANWGDGSTSAETILDPGDSHPYTCAILKIEARCQQQKGEPEETTTISVSVQ